jgi:thiol-disulfide isomerase/thioredoxin
MNVTESEHLSPTIAEALERAHQSHREGATNLAIERLEAELDKSASASDLMQFKGRVSLAVAIAEFCVAVGDREKALRTLATQAVSAKAAFQNIKATGTEDEKRMAFRGLVQMRDFHTQIALMGKPAPEFAVKEWIIGPPTTLVDLKGKVTVLELWATWCKPCEQMFPKLNELHQTYKDQGLVILALTRFFLAYGQTQAQPEELALMRSFVENYGVEFRVGVSEDEQDQTTFGAMGLPLIVLIDRRGLVRLITVSTDDEKFKSILNECLNEPGQESR